MSTADPGDENTSHKIQSKIIDKVKGACPPWKIGELGALVKALNGDEEKIRATISDWWEDSRPQETEWADVNKKGSKRSPRTAGGGAGGGGGNNSGGRGDRGGKGRSNEGRGGRGQRGGRRPREFPDRGGRGGPRSNAPAANTANSAAANGHAPQPQPRSKAASETPGPLPAPNTNAMRPKGAWGQGAPSTAAAATAPPPPPPPLDVTAPVPIIDVDLRTKPAEVPKPRDPPIPSLAEDLSVGPPLVPSAPPVMTHKPVTMPGNVWATKGSAHLIQAEKPKPPAPPAPRPTVQPPKRPVLPPPVIPPTEPIEDVVVVSAPESSLLPPPDISQEQEQPDEPEDVREEQQPLEQQLEPPPEELDNENLPDTTGAETLPEPVEDDIPLSDPVSTISAPPQPALADDLDAGLSASVNGANVNAAGWEPLVEATPNPPEIQTTEVDIMPPPVGHVSAPPAPPVDTAVSLTQEPLPPPVESTSFPDVVDDVAMTAAAPPPSASAVVEPTPPAPPLPKGPATVLNMGHWEPGEGEEAQSLDFGFGTFGPDQEVASVDETTISSSTNNNAGSDPSAASMSATKIQPAPPTTNQPTAALTATTTTVSPARPPPGLSIGMPPMPTNVVHVHELEDKLESTSLSQNGPKPENDSGPVTGMAENRVESSLPEDKPLSATLSTATQTSQQPGTLSVGASETVSQIMPPGGVAPSTYGTAYGMGMYDHNPLTATNSTAGAGFVGVHGSSGPVLPGSVMPQKPQATIHQQSGLGQTSMPPHLQQPQQQQQPQSAGLYGAPSSGSSGIGGSSVDTSTSPNDAGVASAPAGLPPGIPGATMPYGNPALFYSHQQFQMGQPHGGVGYGYGYGAQFGGAMQGGFGYQAQLMSQSGAYGQPYDDQPPQQHHSSHNSHHGSSSHQGGYQKGSHGGGGGYRGRNAHHNSHHGSLGSGSHQGYQNQYNPQQHSGYGGQPYNMGYNLDHFSQRGGYGPGSMDPYNMQQGSGYGSGGLGHSGGFSAQDDLDQPGHVKGKGKGGGAGRGGNGAFGGNPGMHQFQQQTLQPGGGASGVPSQQQPFGLQGGIGDSSTAPGAGAGASTGGWGSNQSWGGQTWQGS